MRGLKPAMQYKIGVQMLFTLFKARNTELKVEMLMKLVTILDLIGMIFLEGNIIRHVDLILLIRGRQYNHQGQL
jgi:hypothetical protein